MDGTDAVLSTPQTKSIPKSFSTESMFKPKTNAFKRGLVQSGVPYPPTTAHRRMLIYNAVEDTTVRLDPKNVIHMVFCRLAWASLKVWALSSSSVSFATPPSLKVL